MKKQISRVTSFVTLAVLASSPGVFDDYAESAREWSTGPKIVDESGQPLTSLFDGSAPIVAFPATLANANRGVDGCEEIPPSVWHSLQRSVADWVRPASVFAQGSCQETSCDGAWMAPWFAPCEFSCGGWFAIYVSNPNFAGPYDGYKRDGGTECCGQVCVQTGCSVI